MRWVNVALSVDLARRNNPLAGLAGDGGDPIEVSVVVHNGQAVGLSGCRDEQVWHLATTLVASSQQALHLTGTPHVLGRRLDELERRQILGYLIPLGSRTRREPKLEIADTRARELTSPHP